MGCCGSRKKSDPSWELERVEVHGANYGRVQEQVVEVYHDEVDGIGHSAHHHEERQFFQLFFSVMDHIQGSQGILRRWEREAQQADHTDGRCNMGKVWQDGTGYIKTLERVKMFVTNKRFNWETRMRLAEWAVKVVKRRSTEYNAAKANGRADPKHLKALEEWRSVKNTLQNLF